MMTDAEREALKRDYPSHYFVRVVRNGWQVLLAIPKSAKGDVNIPNSGGDCWPVETLHGATIYLGAKA